MAEFISGSGPGAEAMGAWDDEGGAAATPVVSSRIIGTVNQVEWAGRIISRINDEFNRVSRSFRDVACKQNAAKRADTEAIIAILEDKRAEVMSKEQAGYFIHGWQEIGDQVRRMIFQDPRYAAIRARRPPRPSIDARIGPGAEITT